MSPIKERGPSSASRHDLRGSRAGVQALLSQLRHLLAVRSRPIPSGPEGLLVAVDSHSRDRIAFATRSDSSTREGASSTKHRRPARARASARDRADRRPRRDGRLRHPDRERGIPQRATSECTTASSSRSRTPMDSILNWYTEEGVIFKGGSGAGVNLSRIRSSHELLKGGGTASGPVSFMRGADASAGTIKSGGKTRRAAKMVILDADHPDVEDFIWCKAIEERKARVLRDAGFDMDLDGADSHSTQYQNANNSVRVTDEFMEAVLDGRDWNLTARTDGSVVRTVPARDLFRQIAHSAWECADPGLQYDTTINRWHTAPNTGRINGSNPCSEYVHLDNSACNLASMNLLDLPRRQRRVRRGGLQGGGVGRLHRAWRSSSATPTTRPRGSPRRRGAFRQLGIGYANLGALLDGRGPAVRLRRRPGLGGRHHRAADRARLRHLGPHRGAHGALRRLPRERRGHARTCCACTRPRPPASTRTSCRPSCSRRRRSPGTPRSSWPRSTACATRRPPFWRRPDVLSVARS